MIAAIILGVFYLSVTFLVGWYIIAPSVEWVADKLHHSAMHAYEIRQEQISQERTFQAAA